MHILDIVREDYYEIWVTQYDKDGEVTFDGPQRPPTRYFHELRGVKRIARTYERLANDRLKNSPLVYQRDGRRVECYVVAVTTTKRRAVQ